MIAQGVTSGGIAVPLLVDASGRVLVDNSSPSLFRPIPKSARFTNLALPAGTSTQTAVTIPASETWRLTALTLIYQGTVAGVTMTGRINNTVTPLRLLVANPVVYDQAYTVLCNVLLAASWSVECVVTGATLNDDLLVDYFAERVL